MDNPHVIKNTKGHPIDREILKAYRQWLHMEGRLLAMELYPEMRKDAERLIENTFASRFHFPADCDWREAPQPSTRAALVLRTVGALPHESASLEEWAAMEFEAWQPSASEWAPPATSEWESLANSHLVWLRTAWIMLQKTKPQLMKALDKIDGEVGTEMKDGFISAINFAKAMLAVLEAAEVRILIAGSALELQDQAS